MKMFRTSSTPAELVSLVVAVTLAGTPAAAQAKVDDAETEELQVRETSVSLSTVASSGEVVLSIRNRSASTISIESVRLESALDGKDRKIDCDPPKCDIDAGKSRAITCTVSPSSILRNPKLLFYREEPLRFRAKVTYGGVEAGTPETAVHEFDASPHAPLAGVILGGIAGVLALPLFRRLWRAYAGADNQSIVKSPSFLVTCCLGWLTIALFLIVARYSSSNLPDLPLQIQVRDFYGGVLCGLLFEPIARWLATLTGGGGAAGPSKAQASGNAPLPSPPGGPTS